ncbi:MAG: NAD(P)H-binding protein [Gemmatimonadaceae bacterium]|jgi:divinyl chlorophyllide a 8-vinyl-reductase|nr:NAD(P)H-binding protein [Gemmatimonadaceae bacterium]
MHITHADHVIGTSAPSPPARRVFLVGATGTIGRATLRALVRHGHDVTCYLRPPRDARQTAEYARLFADVSMRTGVMDRADAIVRDGLRGERFDAVISCLASRTGTPRDAWAVDHDAHQALLAAARECGVPQFVLLSAICVQKPVLAFQQAKLAFERSLMASGLRYSIVRPTAFFKSLSGQLARVQAGKPFLLFGDGRLTACTPIGDDDLADYLVGCLEEPTRWNRVLPIGGPKPALTPREQGEQLFALVGMPPKFSQVPVALLSVIIAVLGVLGRVVPSLAEKAELAKIGRYYATESMLVWDAERARYDVDATPSYGAQTLVDHWRKLMQGDAVDDRGAHRVFT